MKTASNYARPDMTTYIGSAIMFLSFLCMGISMIAVGCGLMDWGIFLAFLSAMGAAGWTGAKMVGDE